MTDPLRSVPRPLLVGGERLRHDAERPRGGGGEKWVPFTVEAAASRLLPQAAIVSAQASDIPQRLRGDRVIVEATLMTNFLANSYFPGDLLDFIDASNVGSRYATAPQRTNKDPKGELEAPTKSLYLAVDDQALGRLESLLANPDSSRVPRRVLEDLQVIEQIRLPNIGDRLLEFVPRSEGAQNDLPVLEAVLHPQGGSRGARSTPAGQLTLDRWRTHIERLGGRVENDWIRVVGNLTFVPVRLNETAFVEAAQFNALRSLHPMPTLRTPGADEPGEEGVVPPPELVEPVRGGSVLRVALFDGGCDDSSPYYAGRVRQIVVGTIVHNSRALRHGALVTSALLYGNDPRPPLEPAQILIDHYQVLPVEDRRGLEMYWLLDVIKAVIDAEDYDVVNLSLGPQRAFEEDVLDRWTAELDEAAHRRDVLFVVAAGNQGASTDETLRRIQVPADMVNGLSVGACDADSPSRRAPYSSIGPGRAGARVSPSGVSFGGTTGQPFRGIDGDGVGLSDTGTSYSAPLTVRGLADLVARTSVGLVSAVTMRAFALHFARPCHRDQLIDHVGHGELRDGYGDVLDCASNVIHLLYRGTVARDEYVPLVLPLPDSIAGRVGLRWTLTTSVEIDPADAVEYAKAGLEIKFRPHANKRTFTKPGRSAQVVDVIADNVFAARLIAEGFSASQQPSSETPKLAGKGEAKLREEGKWETVRQSEKRFTSGRLHRPRLDLTQIAREGGALAYGTQDLNYALFVTLTAEKGVSLYDEVRTTFPVLVPLAAGVDVTVATA